MVSTFLVSLDQTSEFFSIELDEITEFLDIRRISDGSRWQANRPAHQLLWQQSQLVFVDMVVTHVDDQLGCPMVGNVCHQVREGSILRNIEGLACRRITRLSIH